LSESIFAIAVPQLPLPMIPYFILVLMSLGGFEGLG
jgi:hypothetical protein